MGIEQTPPHISTHFHTNREGSTPPHSLLTCFHTNGRFNPSPFVFNTNVVGSTPPLHFQRIFTWTERVQPLFIHFQHISTQTGWVEPLSLHFWRISMQTGRVQPLPICFWHINPENEHKHSFLRFRVWPFILMWYVLLVSSLGQVQVTIWAPKPELATWTQSTWSLFRVRVRLDQKINIMILYFK